MTNEDVKEEVETSQLEDETEVESEEAKESLSAETEQLPEEAESVKEDEKIPEESDKGDLRVALKEERQKRQQLETQLRDPNFVYAQAQQLGLTEEQALQEAQDAEASPQQPLYPAVQEVLAYEKACEQFPKAKSDPEIATIVDGLVGRGIRPVEAVKIVQKQFEKAVETARKEETKKVSQETEVKKKAKTVGSDITASDDTAELTTLMRQAKSPDPTKQKEAMLEILKRKNKAEGIV